MAKSLDDIMSGRGEPVSDEANAPVTTEPASPGADPEAGASRDEQGRFAAKQPEPAAVVEPEIPVTQPAPVQQPSGHVPIQALDAERGKRKDIEERYDRDMRELRDQLARLSQPAPKPAEPPKPAPALWDDPDGYIGHQITPIQQELERTRNTVFQLLASQQFGADKVQAAITAVRDIVGTPEYAALDAEASAATNPFEALVKWHERQTMQAEIGGDLEAYKARLRQQIMDEMSSQQPPQPSPTPQPAQAPTLPTAFAKAPAGGPRGGAEYGGPRPLSEIMGGR